MSASVLKSIAGIKRTSIVSLMRIMKTNIPIFLLTISDKWQNVSCAKFLFQRENGQIINGILLTLYDTTSVPNLKLAERIKKLLGTRDH